MATLQQTRTSGSKFENEITQVISQYTKNIWRNIRIETLLTASGTTEVDIIFCYKDIVFIVEAKNVSAIIGDYCSKTWAFVGSKAPLREVREYTALNTITQNNIHVRSFKDVFYAYFHEWPLVVSAIVVPNDCNVSQDITSGVYTLSQFDKLLLDANSLETEARVHRKVASLLGDGLTTVTRPDFITVGETRRKGGVG